jgi:predicted hotdog family 3-hydroxylacyl-ACP dehydratase
MKTGRFGVEFVQQAVALNGGVMSRSKEKSNTDERKQLVNDLQKLFKKTQALPQVQTITDEIITEEIEKTRNK